MFDQSFSSKKLRRIFDLENRKGNYLDQVFLPEIEAISRQIKSVRARIRKTKSVLRQKYYRAGVIKKRLDDNSSPEYN